MSQKQPTPERPNGSTEESEVTPMQRFKKLARGLLRVAPEQVRDEQARYEDGNSDGKRRPRLRTS